MNTITRSNLGKWICGTGAISGGVAISCYKAVSLIHVNRELNLFLAVAERVVSGNRHQCPILYELVDDFVNRLLSQGPTIRHRRPAHPARPFPARTYPCSAPTV